MSAEDPSPISPGTGTASATGSAPLRKVLTGEESSHFRRSRPTTNRFSTDTASPIRRSSTDAPPLTARRRRSSNFSDYSLGDARKAFQQSTEELISPHGDAAGLRRRETSHWHSIPLAFALFPAIGGLLFQNGSSVVTDIMLLGLAAIFLNWSVRAPWDWYHSAQQIREREEYNEDLGLNEEHEDEALSFSQDTLDKVPEEDEDHARQPAAESMPKTPSHEAAATQLYRHEILALLSCFAFPFLGAYLLHTIRNQLSRPSEGLVSNYNLTIFLLGAEIRPINQLIMLVQSRTLHLQRVVSSNPYNAGSKTSEEQGELLRRLEYLEARIGNQTPETTVIEPSLNGKQASVLVAEVRRSVQPDLDALNRAVRRYEKRSSIQQFQTESRLLDLDARLNDAISLAAAAATGQKQKGFTNIVIEWIATAFVLPLQAIASLASLPFKTITALISFGRSNVSSQKAVDKRKTPSNGKYPAHGGVTDRVRSRVGKR